MQMGNASHEFDMVPEVLKEEYEVLMQNFRD